MKPEQAKEAAAQATPTPAATPAPASAAASATAKPSAPQSIQTPAGSQQVLALFFQMPRSLLLRICNLQTPPSTTGASKSSATSPHSHSHTSQPQTHLPEGAAGTFCFFLRLAAFSHAPTGDLANRLGSIGNGANPSGGGGGIQGSGNVSGSFGRSMGLAREVTSLITNDDVITTA